MRKKLNIIAAAVLILTLMFGSTLCYAAEGTAKLAEESRAIARSQSESGVFAFSDDNTTIYVRLYWEWNEGYTGWFRSAAFVNMTSGVMTGFSFSDTGNSSYITVSVSYEYGGKLWTASQQFYVDEYGSVY